MPTMGLDVHQRLPVVCILDVNGKRINEFRVRGHGSKRIAELGKLEQPFAIRYEASCGYGYLYDEVSRIARRVPNGSAASSVSFIASAGRTRAYTGRGPRLAGKPYGVRSAFAPSSSCFNTAIRIAGRSRCRRGRTGWCASWSACCAAAKCGKRSKTQKTKTIGREPGDKPNARRRRRLKVRRERRRGV